MDYEAKSQGGPRSLGRLNAVPADGSTELPSALNSATPVVRRKPVRPGRESDVVRFV